MELIARRQLTIGRTSYQTGQQFSIDAYFGRQLIRDNKAYEATGVEVTTNTGLVSCIMPTRDRRKWIPRAIECWQSQTYQPMQLVIVDNGADPIKDLLPNDNRIIYSRAGIGLKLGMLRNLACQMASGEFIAHWDDDDWYSRDRIAKQVEAIGSAPVCAMRSCLFDEPGSQAYLYEAPPLHAVGASLFYRRDWWMRNRFANDLTVGEDNMFFRNAARQATLIEGTDLLVASIHSANTSPRDEKKHWRSATLPKEYRCPSGM